MSRPLRLGVIGRGVWGCHSLEQELIKRPDVEVTAVTAGPEWGACCFDDPAAAGREYARELGADYRDDWRDVALDPEIDVLSLMTSPATRREPAVAALEAGTHVVVDKPLAAAVEDARAIAEAEASSSAVGFMLAGYHTRRAVERLRRVLEAGKIGAVHHIRVELLFTGGMIPGFTPTKEWISGTAGGELTTIGSHAFITLLALTDARPAAISARTANLFYEEYSPLGAEDWAEALFHFDDGSLGMVRCGRVPYEMDREPFSVDVVGSGGGARLAADDLTLSPCGERFTDPGGRAELVGRAFETFFAAIEGHEKPATTFAEGLLLARMLEAAYGSADEGREVPVGR